VIDDPGMKFSKDMPFVMAKKGRKME